MSALLEYAGRARDVPALSIWLFGYEVSVVNCLMFRDRTSSLVVTEHSSVVWDLSVS